MTDVINEEIIISSGQSISDLNVGKDAVVEVKDGGTLQTATVNPGGWVTVFSGGTATGVTENGGYVDDRNGAIVTFVANTIPSLVVSAGENATIHSATTVTTTLVTGDEHDAGWLTIYPGATVNDLTVTSGGQIDTDGNVTSVIARDDGYVNVRGGLMNGATIDKGGVGVIYYRGTAWNVAVNSGGRYMLYGGLGTATTVSSGGYFVVQEGSQTISGSTTTYIGSATQTVITGGTMRVVSGGAATEVNMTDGYLSAFNGGTIDQLTMNGGSVLITGTTEGVGTLTNLNMLGGYTEVESGGLISGANVAGGNVMVRSAGTLADAKLNSGAGATILGSASAIELDGATATVFGAVTTAVLNTGDFLLQSGAVVDGATVNAGFIWNTQVDTLVTGTTVKGGEVTVAGSASGAIVDQGSFTVVMGGTANDVTVYDGSVGVNGTGAVADGVNVGSARNLLDPEPEVPKSATLDVLNGGYVKNLTVTYGGTANVNVLASVTGATTTAQDAVINLSAGATMRDVEVNLGTVNVAGILTDVALHGYGMTPFGAMFPPTYPEGAELNVLSGGTAFNANLNSASAVIGDGGVVSGATLNKVARMTVSGGGVLTGQVSIEDDKDTGVTVSEGGIVNFDLTGTTAGDAARIVGLKRISSAPTYTLTVSSEQAVGTYRLADNAGTFNSPITVKTFYDELGSITFTNYILVGENYYILKSQSGGVDLCISTEVPSLPYLTVYANSEWAGLADGTVVPVTGGTAVIGIDAFASADQASDAVRPDGTVNVEGGTAVFVYGVNRNVVVASGAVVADSKVNSGATLTLNTGAAACGLRVEESATLVAQSGTTLTGECLWDTDAVVTVDGEIVFDISASTAETYTTQFWNLGKNTGTPSYTVVIGETQENGQYTLAWNSQGQGAPATLKLDDGTTIGTLTAGTPLRYGEQTYTLGQGYGPSMNWLQLVVADYIPSFDHVYVNSDWAELEKGAVVDVDGGTAIIGTDAFADADTAVVSTIEDGTIIIEGGVAQFTDAIARNVTVKSGATLCDPFLPNGLTLTVNAGGTLTANGAAETSFSAGSTVQLNGGTLNFDITAPTAASATLLSGLSYVQGTPDIVLTVKDVQTKGVYTLSTEAAGFTGSITVKNTIGEPVGTLTVGGSPVAYGNLAYTLSLSGEGVLSVTVDDAPAPPAGTAKSDIDGNGVSDVMFVWSGNNYQHGYWMNGTNEWQSAGSNHPAEWENLGCYDMTGDGKADSVLIGNVVVEGVKGAYVGYYIDGDDNPDGSTWVNIGFLNNSDNIDWKNKVGNLTGNASGANSIVWYTHELGTLGAWTDGTENWVTIAGGFDASWALIGCGDFSGDGKDQIVMSLDSGANYYAIGIDNTWTDLGASDSGWEVRAIGDFSGDGMDDVVAFHKETGIVAMWGDGNSANWSQLGQLDASDWFIVGCGDYNGDQKDDLLVRQYSTGMLGYYSGGDMENGWVELGRGVDMNWTVVSGTADDTLAPVRSDIDGNGVSDVMFVWSGNNYQHGYWMNGTNEWQSAGSNHPAEWENLGCYDMTGDGKADSVLIGNVVVEGVKGAYVGYYIDGDDNPDGSTWVNIGFLNNSDNIDWKNKVGNLTGNASGANSIVWYTHELGTLGAWTDGTENWVTIAGGFDASWALIGCGDFSGDGKDQIVMSLDSGANYYAIGIDNTWTDLGASDSGWEVRAIGDFSGDGRDDIVAFHKETGLVAMWGDGVSSNWSNLGQLDASDWFVVGAGDYNGDQKDDILVRQYSTGMLGYYSGADTTQWVELGRGVDMNWTVIA